jgi:hypothetical protein
MFFPGSRYEKVADDQIALEGRVIVFKKTRFIPETTGLVGHSVTQGERLDHIAHQFYKEPDRFWRICDANRAMWPDDLVAEVGRTILIPPAEG